MYHRAHIKRALLNIEIYYNLIFTELFIFSWFKLEMYFQKTERFATSNLTRDNHLIKLSQIVSLDKLAIQNKLVLSLS